MSQMHDLRVSSSPTMIQTRMRGCDVRVKMFIQFWKQLGRSVLLLAHYVSLFACFAHRTVGWFVEAVAWTSVLAHHTLWFFERVQRKLRRLCQRHGVKVVTNHDTKSG